MNIDIHWLRWVGEAAVGFLGGVSAYFALPKILGDWWLEKVKTAHAKQLESLKASIEQSTFVTRAHFETEFAAMKDMFKYLSEVRFAINELRPALRVEPLEQPDDAKRSRLGDRLGKLTQAHDVLLNQTESLSPFYPPDLHQALRKCIKASHNEVTDVMTSDSPGHDQTFSAGWYKQGRINREEFQAAYDEVAKIIRDRLATLAVLPST